MRITVKLFAAYREMAGASEVPVEVAEGATVSQALEALARSVPALADQPYRPITACNLRHVPADHRLSPGDELAVFPPVSGG